MPYVKIELTPPGISKEQKLRIIKGVTQLLIDVLNKDPKLTHVVICEIESDNWGFDNQQATGRLTPKSE